MIRILTTRLAVFLASCFAANIAAFAQFDDSSLEFFENRVRPILVEHCSECHSADAESLQGGLSVESRSSLVSGGDTGPAIIPGDPKNSLLIDAINYRGLYEMPPDSKLPAEKIKVLDDWVRRNAPWPNHDDNGTAVASEFDLEQRRADHWSWQPIRQISVPQLEDSKWPIDPIDSFILKKLNEHELQPAADCDKRTWIRRVHFDLIGLPPAPADVAAFLQDDSERSYERVVDYLLASPRFGERWARHWMDLVRYAETYGHEFDFPIEHAYQYRDYLIRAFNDDLPFDDFIREHIAGDLIENPRIHPNETFNESILGTGSWFLGEATHGPVDVKADEAGRIDNQIDVMGKTFLGLTVACARCHDHKFDAISAADYYALAGYLQSSRRQIALLDPRNAIENTVNAARESVANADTMIDDVVSEMRELQTDDWAKDLKLAGVTPDSVATKPEKSQTKSPNKKIDFRAVSRLKPLGKATHPLHVLSLAFADDTSFLKFQIVEYKKTLTKQAEQHQQFIDASELYENFSHGIPDNWFVTGWAFDRPDQNMGFSTAGSIITPNSLVSSGRLGNQFQGVLRSPTFELNHDRIALRAKGNACNVRLVIDGYEMDIHNPLLFAGCKIDLVNKDEFGWIVLDADVKNYRGHRAYLEFNDLGDGFFQVDEIRLVDDSDVNPVDPIPEFAKWVLEHNPFDREQCTAAISRSFSKCFETPDALPIAERSEILSLLTEFSSTGQTLVDARNSILEIGTKSPDPMLAIAMADGTPEDENLFIRGNTKTLGPLVPRRFLTALSTTENSAPENHNPLFAIGSGRLNLADQIASPNNPLTGRVIVNRIWRHLLGEGIVRSVDNFGVLGEKPSHPELLDFIATQFIEDGWSIKNLIRRIVLSRTYRMNSDIRSDAAKIDPDNRLLHRAHMTRLEGEAIRDSILKVAGTLNTKMYGPAVGIHLTDFMQGRGRPRSSGPVDGEGRRSIYIEVRRNFLPPMMLAFDTPIPFNTIGDRHQSNVPAQALIMMNDPFVFGQAAQWAANIMAQSNERAARIETVFLHAFGRQPTDAESNNANLFIDAQAKEHGIENQDVSNSQEVWQDFCHVVFNMKEFIYIN